MQGVAVLPARVGTLVIGGGVAGVSLAHHLALRTKGHETVLVIDRVGYSHVFPCFLSVFSRCVRAGRAGNEMAARLHYLPSPTPHHYRWRENSARDYLNLSTRPSHLITPSLPPGSGSISPSKLNSEPPSLFWITASFLGPPPVDIPERVPALKFRIP